MTTQQIRDEIVRLQDKAVAQKNSYSQNASKRECVFTKYKDGKYYSDCSSAVRKITETADPTTKPLGGNTVAQYGNKKGKIVNCKIVNGIPTDTSVLRIGDCFFFAGSDSGRAYADYVGHVEQVHAISGNKVTLFGHGSGNPSASHEMVAYCRNRQNTKTSTKKGNRGLLKVVRFIQDDGTGTGGTAEPTPNYSLGDRILKKGMVGDDVKELQKALKELGFFAGSIGGNYLDITETAVKEFQKKYELDVDGQFGPKSLEALKTVQTGGETAPDPVIPSSSVLTATGNVHTRLGPDTKYSSEGVIKKGAKVTALLDENGKKVLVSGWYAIVVDGAVLWASAKYLN